MAALGPLGAMNNQATRAGIVRTQDNSLQPDEPSTPIVVIQQNRGEGIEEEIPKNEVVISMALKSK